MGDRRGCWGAPRVGGGGGPPRMGLQPRIGEGPFLKCSRGLEARNLNPQTRGRGGHERGITRGSEARGREPARRRLSRIPVRTEQRLRQPPLHRWLHRHGRSKPGAPKSPILHRRLLSRPGPTLREHLLAMMQKSGANSLRFPRQARGAALAALESAALRPSFRADILRGSSALRAWIGCGADGPGESTAAVGNVSGSGEKRLWHATAKIHPSAMVDPAAALDAGAVVGAGCLVGPGALIGADAVLSSHVVVPSNTAVHPHPHSHPNAHPKPETRNPKPETRNPKPETRSPEPQPRWM